MKLLKRISCVLVAIAIICTCIIPTNTYAKASKKDIGKVYAKYLEKHPLKIVNEDYSESIKGIKEFAVGKMDDSGVPIIMFSMYDYDDSMEWPTLGIYQYKDGKIKKIYDKITMKKYSYDGIESHYAKDDEVYICNKKHLHVFDYTYQREQVGKIKNGKFVEYCERTLGSDSSFSYNEKTTYIRGIVCTGISEKHYKKLLKGCKKTSKWYENNAENRKKLKAGTLF